MCALTELPRRLEYTRAHRRNCFTRSSTLVCTDGTVSCSEAPTTGRSFVIPGTDDDGAIDDFHACTSGVADRDAIDRTQAPATDGGCAAMYDTAMLCNPAGPRIGEFTVGRPSGFADYTGPTTRGRLHGADYTGPTIRGRLHGADCTGPNAAYGSHVGSTCVDSGWLVQPCQRDDGTPAGESDTRPRSASLASRDG